MARMLAPASRRLQSANRQSPTGSFVASRRLLSQGVTSRRKDFFDLSRTVWVFQVNRVTPLAVYTYPEQANSLIRGAFFFLVPSEPGEPGRYGTLRARTHAGARACKGF
jgi:hypothetical protein